MTASIRNTQTTSNSSTTSLTTNRPTGTVDGDLLVNFLSKDGADTTTTPPSGFTNQSGLGGNFGSHESRVATKTASSEPTTYTVSWSGNEGGVMFTTAFQDHDGTDVSGFASSSVNTTSVTVSSITTTVDDCLLVAWVASETGAAVFSATGWTKETELGVGATGS